MGDWEMELSNAAFLPRPSDRVGPVLIEWVQDGAFLALRMGDKLPNPPMLRPQQNEGSTSPAIRQTDPSCMVSQA